MTVKTQGTEFWALNPNTGELIPVGCITAIDGVDTSLDQIETTCLNALTRTYEAGLATPGSASFTINVDPRNQHHVRLFQLKQAGVTLRWAIGWRQNDSKGEPVLPGAAPTVATDPEAGKIFELPGARAWLIYDGYMVTFPFSFAQNTVVQSNISIQITGEPVLVPPETNS